MFVYAIAPGAKQTTNATPNTENDCFFIAAGSAGRATKLFQLQFHGKSGGASLLSGLTFRLKKWFTTAASGGTGITPNPRDGTVQASKCTAGYAATGGVTTGTGGPTLLGSWGCGVTGANGWVAPNEDAQHLVEAGSADSLDIFSHCATASLDFELSSEVAE